MTFEEFKTSGIDCDDVEIAHEGLILDTTPIPGRLYADSYWIEKTCHWDSGLNDGKKWYLRIGNCEWLSNDLNELEKLIYDDFFGCETE